VTCARMHARCHSRHRVANELACGRSFRSHAAGLCPVVCERRVGSPARTSACMREDIRVFARACDWMKHDILMLFVAENMGPGGEAPYDPRLRRPLAASTKPLHPPARLVLHNEVRLHLSCRVTRARTFLLSVPRDALNKRYFSSRSQIALNKREPRLHEKHTHLPVEICRILTDASLVACATAELFEAKQYWAQRSPCILQRG